MGFIFNPIEGAPYRLDYGMIADELNAMFEAKDQLNYGATIRQLCQEDLFFLIYFVLGIKEINHPWIVARANEVENKLDGTLDLWPRGHYKSTIKSLGVPLRDIFRNPEERIVFFSHTRDIAKAFLRRVKLVLEQNMILNTVFSDILYKNPTKQSPKWSEDEGIVVKRKGTYLESSVEAWGLVDGMPTSKHFTKMYYDDLITEKTVNTPEQMKKLEDGFRMSDGLSDRYAVKTVTGTIYHFGDLHRKLEKDSIWETRKYPAMTKEGDYSTGVFLNEDELLKKARIMGPYIFSCQMMMNPVAKENQKFLLDWIQYYKEIVTKLNKYLIVDPASEQKKKSDYTVIMCIGVDSQENYYILDMVRDKLTGEQTFDEMVKMMKKHGRIIHVGYEKYGKDRDIELYKNLMKTKGIYFTIEPLGGKTAKIDRILSLVSLFHAKRIFLPPEIKRIDYEYKEHDLVQDFINEEYLEAPYSSHDDMMDCLARINSESMNITFPGFKMSEQEKKYSYNPLESNRSNELGWMAM
jgi:predicted phage terminase large subunit-like protein